MSSRLGNWMSGMLTKSVTGRASAYHHSGVDPTWSVIESNISPLDNKTYNRPNSWYEKGYRQSLYQHEGGPAYLDPTLHPGPYAQRSKWEHFTGLTYMEARQKIADILSSNKRDPAIIEEIKNKSHVFIPLRTGHLMNEIFKTMRIDRSSFYNVHFFAVFNYEYPPDRPNTIRGRVQHSPPDMGYGDWGTVKLTERIPMSRVQIVYTTPYGNALYWLNDPDARHRPETYIDNIARVELDNDYKTAFNDVIITMIM